MGSFFEETSATGAPNLLDLEHEDASVDNADAIFLLDPPPGGWESWENHPEISEHSQGQDGYISYKIRYEYYGFDDSADSALAVVEGNRKQAVFDVVRAALKYFGKDYSNAAVNELLKGDKESLEDAWDAEKKE